MQPESIGWADRLTALRALPGWLELPAADLALIASIATARVVEPGQVLVEEGRPLHSIFVVVDGELSVRRAGRDRVARSRDLVGAVSGLARDPGGLSCTSIGRSALLELSLDDLEDVLEDRSTLLARWMRTVARDCLRWTREVPAPAGRGLRLDPPLDLVDRISLLRCTELLDGAGVDALASFAGAAREIDLVEWEALWSSSDRSDTIAVVAKGRIQARATTGVSVSLASGDVLGVLEAFAEEPRWYDAFAETRATLLVLDRDAMIDVWEDHPEVGVEMLRAVCAELLALPDAAP